MRFGIKSAGAATAVVTCAAFLPAPAQAATAAGQARVIGDSVHVEAGRGAVNDVVLTGSGRTVTIDDRVAINPGPGCAAVPGDRTRVRCTTTEPLRWLYASLGDGNDRLIARTAARVFAEGGAGADRITGGSGRDSLHGDSGDDVLSGGRGADALAGGGGNDSLDGGRGDDILNADAGRDRLRGGTGRDLVYYGSRQAPVLVDLDGAEGDDGARGEGDSVGADVEDIIGGAGADRLIGNAAGNRIWGGGGNDHLAGGAGHDILVGQAGNDTLRGGAGDDHLIGERDSREQGKDNPRARDRLNGGTAARRGDICEAGPAATMVSCEIRRAR
ncbi:Ca2+-binding RTX toxin-like protein [Actinoplanes octamycinicus]|uniref:Ca2+-binding RTX toxin-like protein n=1 Tax=Actinoplanes octamycinicus TaxID=135948 RepID=A0A7W7GRZ4_9ACTN|nr:calcium-binding protein [Actinoplanes octamycinicus]MBB4737225.1 Ca2+-binding RTX toxin-like protein [Actinoplanes octamycinicus]GIE61955.1 hypothetical protein Aoc01nite_73570 [Actinoplanes octamycinicus]